MNNVMKNIATIALLLFLPLSIAAERGIVMEGPSRMEKGNSHFDLSMDSKNSKFNFGASVFEDDQVVTKANYGFDIYDWLEFRLGTLHVQRDTQKFSPFKDRITGLTYGLKLRGKASRHNTLDSPFGDDPEFKNSETLDRGDYYFGFNVGTLSGSELYQLSVLDLASLNNAYVVVSKNQLSGRGLMRLRYDVGASIGLIPAHTMTVGNEQVHFDASRVINLFANVEKPIVNQFHFIGEVVAFRFTGDFNVVEEFSLWNAGFRYRWKKGFVDAYATDLTGAHTDPGFGMKATLEF